MEIFLGSFTAEWEQRKAAFLHDLTLGRRSLPAEEERRRRGGGVPPAAPAGMAKQPGCQFRRGGEDRPARHRRADRPMRARFAGLASGSQPAVVKVASFGGGSRLGAMINYISRNGAVLVENERGDQRRGRGQQAAVGDEWVHLMKNRAESRDIGLFKISVADAGRADDDIIERAQVIVKHGLGDRAFVFAVTARPDAGGFDIEGVVVLRSAGGERLTADDEAAAIVQARMDRAESAKASAAFRFAGYGNGTDYGTSQVRSLVVAHKGSVQDEQGRAIADAKQAGDLVQREWRDHLHSRKPRDVMHLILSARAGTDTAAFQNAARDFLGQQFVGHRYVFSLHEAASDPKAEAAGGKRPHVHIHAIIAMRSDAGDRVETTIPAFRQWRVTMAEKARSHGINMEMTDRRDRASAPAYSKNQVRPVNTIGRTRHEGTSSVADRRYTQKRDDRPSYPSTTRSRTYMHKAHVEWQEMRHSGAARRQQDFIQSQLARLDDRQAPVDGRHPAREEAIHSSSQFRRHLVKLADLVSGGDNMRHMTRPEFEAYEKRVETALLLARKAILPEEREDFEEIAQAAREHVNVRREIVELLEDRAASRTSNLRSSEPGKGAPHYDKQWWDAAVTRHGLAATDSANKALVDIELIREAIKRINEDGPNEVSALKKELETHMAKAAELALSGNGIVREAAEIDDELKTTLQMLERNRHRIEGAKMNTRADFDAAARASRDASNGEQLQIPAVDRDIRAQESLMDSASRPDPGDVIGSHPAKQRVPRLVEIQRKANERNERDQDDRER